MIIRRSAHVIHLLLATFAFAQSIPPRPMTFMDVVTVRSVSQPAVSPDARWMAYTLTTPDWQAGKSFSDIYLAPLAGGDAKARRMTFTKEKNESSPQWSRDSRGVAFLSNREAPEGKAAQNQLYYLRIDGGEALRISEGKEGVHSFAFSKEGTWLAFSSGKEDDRQIWIVPVSGLGINTPTKLTSHKASIESWQFSPDGTSIYFVSADSADVPNRERKEKKFDVRIRNEVTPLQRLWRIDCTTKAMKNLTPDAPFAVEGVSISDDGTWIGFRGIPDDRTIRNTTDESTFGDLYLIHVPTGAMERLTNNADIEEGGIVFSPDSKLLAFSAADDFEFFRNERIYVRPVSDSTAPLRKLGSDFDGDLHIAFWSSDSRTIYCNAGVGATNQLLSVSVSTGKTSQLTHDEASTQISYDRHAKVFTASYSNPTTPRNFYHIPSLARIRDRGSWIRLTDSNPQVESLKLGTTEAYRWTSTDGAEVEGVLVKPIDYVPGKRYPLIVQIHGGPAGAEVLSFNANCYYYSQVFAGAGYVCLLPNYRGSSNYGERHKLQIAGDYFRQGYDDILSGVDALIRAGIVDSAALGCMGWSAGGHWSNWILTHTNRFKAISSGAGAMNWISMYAQTDVQRVREFYFGGTPYDRFEHYWDVSPLKHIANAKTPTLIHVVDGDPRVPRPQSDELYMALRTHGVPTEYFVYPGSSHGLTELRHQMIKMVSEFNWFERYVRGNPGWFEWKDLLSTFTEDTPKKQE